MKKNPDIPVRTARERTPDTERPVVWQKRPERKASVFFSKYGLYKHYDIKNDAISRYIYTGLQSGSIMKGWMERENEMIACCSDGTRPVIFKIERIDYEEE